jgi:hypothetical protein
MELAEHRVARTHSKHTGRELAKKIRKSLGKVGRYRVRLCRATLDS